MVKFSFTRPFFSSHSARRSHPQKSPRWSSQKRTIRLARLNRDRAVIDCDSPRSLREPSRQWQVLNLWILATLAIVGASGLGAKWLFRHWSASGCQTVLPMTSDSERLYCIQVAAESGDLESLLEAMNLVGSWEKNHPLFAEGQNLLRDWSSLLFNLAQQQLDAGRLEEAIAIANKIPVKSPLYPEARLAIAAWQQEWQQGEAAVGEFETALQKRNWRGAMNAVEGLAEFQLEYWRDRQTEQFLDRLSREKQAAATLQEARDLAENPTAHSLAAAIARVKQIDPKTFAAREAKTSQTLWSRTVLKMAAERLQSEDYAGAIATAKAIPQGDALYPEAQDWIVLSRASESAEKDDEKALRSALETVSKIDPQSPLFAQARTRAQVWQAKIQG